jgi:hypothetical protein
MSFLYSDTRAQRVETIKLDPVARSTNFAVIAPIRGGSQYALSFHDSARSFLRASGKLGAISHAIGWQDLNDGNHLGVGGRVGLEYFTGKIFNTFCEAWCELNTIVSPQYKLVKSPYHKRGGGWVENPSCQCL